VCADFTDDYEVPAAMTEVRSRVTYFPGSTIGNFVPGKAVTVLRNLGTLGHGMLIGIDLEKDRSILEPAYDDAAGYSREFALNLLVRLNRELGADFVVEQFGYEAPYNEEAARIEMTLVSERKQSVHIDRHRVEFRRDERMLTEYSYKFDLDGFAELAGKAGLEVAETWTDPEDLFGLPERVVAGDRVVVLGAEGRGLRPGIAGVLDHRVQIPMAGRIGSLNVSAAAAVLLFELRRRSGRLARSGDLTY